MTGNDKSFPGLRNSPWLSFRNLKSGENLECLRLLMPSGFLHVTDQYNFVLDYFLVCAYKRKRLLLSSLVAAQGTNHAELTKPKKDPA